MHNKVIDSFRGEYSFLSNFHRCKIEYDGMKFICAEGAFQAAKTELKSEKVKFCSLDGRKSKNAGKFVTLRKGWDNIRVEVMTEIIRAKFTQNKKLAKALIDTGDAYIVEKNTWCDNFWGECTCIKCENKVGKKKIVKNNNLGKILMIIRSELQDDM